MYSLGFSTVKRKENEIQFLSNKFTLRLCKFNQIAMNSDSILARRTFGSNYYDLKTSFITINVEGNKTTLFLLLSKC